MSDDPHTEGTWPNSRLQVEKDMGDLAADLRWKLVHDNAAAHYGL